MNTHEAGPNLENLPPETMAQEGKWPIFGIREAVLDKLHGARRRIITGAGILISAAGVSAMEAPLAIANQSHGDFITISYNGEQASCPDPDAFNGQDQIFVSCTSDYGQKNPSHNQRGYSQNAGKFPIYGLNMRTHELEFKNFIFPNGEHPWMAEPKGRYWADEIHHIQNHWVAYFGAQINPTRFEQVYHKQIPQNEFGIFVAWTDKLLGGKWHSRLLHYSGQFNGVPGNGQEVSGGVIDPSVSTNTKDGKLYMVWNKQFDQVWIGELTPDGLTLKSNVKRAFSGNQKKYPWECDPGCVTEGPVLEQNPVTGVDYIMTNTGSTWDQSYKVGVAASTDPMGKWTMNDQPILSSASTGFQLKGPGIGSQHFKGPDGKLYEAFHYINSPTHVSQDRYLAIGRFTFSGGNTMAIPSEASAASTNTTSSKVTVSVPSIK